MLEPSRELLASIPGLRDAIVVGRLGDGPVSDSWRLRTYRRDWVLRVDRPLAQALGLDREAEWAVLQAAHRAQLAPEPTWRDPARGLMLTGWLPGRTWVGSDLADPSHLDALARLLRSVHALPLDERTAKAAFDPALAARRYAEVSQLPDDEPRLRAVGQLAGELYPPELNRRLCHMDPHAGNVVGKAAPGGIGMRLIDWEYAAAGDPLFDLSVVIRYHDLPAPAASRLLDAWNGSHDPALAERLDAMNQLYSLLADLWQTAVALE